GRGGRAAAAAVGRGGGDEHVAHALERGRVARIRGEDRGGCVGIHARDRERPAVPEYTRLAERDHVLAAAPRRRRRTRRRGRDDAGPQPPATAGEPGADVVAGVLQLTWLPRLEARERAADDGRLQAA